MIRRPPRSTLDRSSAASDVYKRQLLQDLPAGSYREIVFENDLVNLYQLFDVHVHAVSYTHLRAHETVLDLVCRLLLEKKKLTIYTHTIHKSILKTNYTLTHIHTHCSATSSDRVYNMSTCY